MHRKIIYTRMQILSHARTKLLASLQDCTHHMNVVQPQKNYVLLYVVHVCCNLSKKEVNTLSMSRSNFVSVSVV